MPLRVTRARWDVATKRAAGEFIAPQYLPDLLRFYLHSWDGRVSMTRRYSTDVTESIAGGEERWQLWPRPMLTLDLDLRGLEFDQARGMREIVLRHLHQRMVVPIYPDVVNLTSSATDASTFAGDTGGGRAFFPGGLVLLAELGQFGHPVAYGVGIINTVTGSGFTTTLPIIGTFTTHGGVAIPLMEVSPSDQASMTLPTSGPGAALSLTLNEVQGPAAIPPLVNAGDWPTMGDTYDQHPILPAWAGMLEGQSAGASRAGAVGPEGRGTRVALHGDRPRESWDIEIKAFGRDQCHRVLEILDYCAGRARPLWCLGKLGVAITAIAEGTITVTLPSTYDDFVRFWPGHIGLDYRDGRINIYQVDSITPSGSTSAVLTLASLVPVNRRTVADVLHAAPAYLVRQQNDEVTLEWQSATCFLSTMPVVELHREGRTEVFRVTDPITPVDSPADLEDLWCWATSSALATVLVPGGAEATVDGDDVDKWVAAGTASLIDEDASAPYHEWYPTDVGQPIRAANLPSLSTTPTWFELDDVDPTPYSNALGMTVFMVVRVRDTDATPDGLILMDTPDSGVIEWTPTRLVLKTDRNGNEVADFIVDTPDITLPREEWHILAFVWRPGRHTRVYQNGLFMGEATVAPDHLGEMSPTDLPRVFAANNPTADAFSVDDTAIHDVVIYRRALEPEEMNAVGQWFVTPVSSTDPPVTAPDGVAWQRVH